AVWQENTSKLWWKWDGTTWPGAGTATSPLPAAKPDDTLTIRVQETAWQGDAKFNVKMDGVQVGGTLTASALKASNDSNVFVLKGNWASGAHNVQIQFINDAYGGSATTDRNLYVNSIDYNGKTYANTAAALMGNSTKSFTVGGNTTVGAAPYDTLTLHLSQDAYSGNAQFVLTIDGKTISTPQDVTALHSAGAWQDVSFSGNFGAGTHTVGVQFTNDAYGGSGNDRNLYVNGVDCNGTHYGSGVTSLYSNGTATFTITTQH
ncbi:MAG: hypothetical protein JSS43_10210, partial [Proteobacteria bacterium]|nr:hypothetical protein [Pseudomonadota bacterium]